MKSTYCKGVVRDRTKAFFKFKRTEPFMNERFKPKKESLFKDFHEKHSDECENPSQSLLQDDEDRNGFHAHKSRTKLDNKEKHTLPPRWVDQEEQVEENIVEINKKLVILDNEIKKIKHHTYMTNEHIPIGTIERTNTEIVDLIRSSEIELKEIMSFKADTEIDNNIRKNVHYSLAIKLRELTQQTKQREKELMKIMIKHNGQDDMEKGEDLLDDFDDELQVHQKERNRMQHAKSKEIEEIVSATNDLAALFKELSVLVIEQGTILDRIDFNIEESLQHTKKGKKHLIEAKKASESTRARNIIM